LRVSRVSPQTSRKTRKHARTTHVLVQKFAA
jgi:hypothetical protein